MTHDLMKCSIQAMGYSVSRIFITALVGNTYHASIHYSPEGHGGPEIQVDARPSDALNLAVRFSSRIFINRAVAEKMAHKGPPVVANLTAEELVKTAREEMLYHADPTVMVKLEMDLAVGNEDYERAKTYQRQLDEMVLGNRELGLLVALETSIEDERYEEAAYFRDELRKMRLEGKCAPRTPWGAREEQASGTRGRSPLSGSGSGTHSW